MMGAVPLCPQLQPHWSLSLCLQQPDSLLQLLCLCSKLPATSHDTLGPFASFPWSPGYSQSHETLCMNWTQFYLLIVTLV
ncbi:hypothetical protein XELAEV_18005110mg [Xenopus laevis]|uniref:Uncharacterized protein n=1 Tax=Xenopus laevis TaxID=8355 RepID=A0A974I2X2_XENLA|nr:hypothetical protein XELAEV_18005110mg [Xenopus laevis]